MKATADEMTKILEGYEEQLADLDSKIGMASETLKGVRAKHEATINRLRAYIREINSPQESLGLHTDPTQTETANHGLQLVAHGKAELIDDKKEPKIPDGPAQPTKTRKRRPRRAS